MPITSQRWWWNKREESRKSWDHIHCDKLVYVAQVGDADGKLPHVFTEKYLRGDLWLHIRWLEADARNAGNRQYEAILDGVVPNTAHQSVSNRYHPIPAIHGNTAMLIDIPKLIELPEGMRLYGISSVLRLKRVKSGVNIAMEQAPFPTVGFIGVADRENDLPRSFVGRGNGIGEKMHQVPGQLVESGAEAVDEISHAKGDGFVDSVWGDYEKVLRSVAVVLFDDGVRVAFNPASNHRLRRLEVKVCPAGFHVDVIQ